MQSRFRWAVALVLAVIFTGVACDEQEDDAPRAQTGEGVAQRSDERQAGQSTKSCRVLLSYSRGAETMPNNQRSVGEHRWLDVRFGEGAGVDEGQGLVARAPVGWRIVVPRSSRTFQGGLATEVTRAWHAYAPDGTRSQLRGGTDQMPDVGPGDIATWLADQPQLRPPGGYQRGGPGWDVVAAIGGVLTFDTLAEPGFARYRTLDWSGEPIGLVSALEDEHRDSFGAWVAGDQPSAILDSAKQHAADAGAVGGPVFVEDGLRFALTFDVDTAFPTSSSGLYDVPGNEHLTPPEDGWWTQVGGCAFSFIDGNVMVRTSADGALAKGAGWHPDWRLTSITWVDPKRDLPLDRLSELESAPREVAVEMLAKARAQASNGRLAKSARALQVALEQYGDDPALLNELGFIEMTRDRMDAARHALTLAWIHRGAPTTSGADRGDLNGRILYNLGRWSEADGDRESAIVFYRESLERRPNESVEERLSRLQD